jgi:hypothetical protein
MPLSNLAVRRWARGISLASIAAVGAALAIRYSAPTVANAQGGDWAAVEQVLRRQATILPGGIARFDLPRTDLKVKMADRWWQIDFKPAFASSGWIALKKMPDGKALLMADLALSGDEVGPVFRHFIEGPLTVKSIHNHLAGENPGIMYMHIGGVGDAVALATQIRGAFDSTGLAMAPSLDPDNDAITIDTVEIGKILGAKGTLNGGVVTYTIPRTGLKVMEGKYEIPALMGFSNEIRCQPTGKADMAVTGNLVLLPSEVPAALDVFRQNKLVATGIHTYLSESEPRVVFVHFYGRGSTLPLARGLKEAMGKQGAAGAVKTGAK